MLFNKSCPNWVLQPTKSQVRTIGQQKVVEITAHSRLQQRPKPKRFAIGAKSGTISPRPRENSGAVLTPGNCSAKTSCNFSLTNLKWLADLCPLLAHCWPHLRRTPVVRFFPIFPAAPVGRPASVRGMACPIKSAATFMALIYTQSSGFLIASAIGPWWLMFRSSPNRRRTVFCKIPLSVCWACFYWGFVPAKALGSFLILCPWVSTFSLHLRGGGKLFGIP